MGGRTQWQPPTGQENAAAAAPPGASRVPEQESISDSGAGEIQSDDRDGTAVGIAGPEASSGESSPAAAPLPPLTEEIVAKLAAANLLESVDAPLHSPESEVIGTGLTLRGGRRIAVIERELKRDDPELELLFRRFDGVIIRGPGKDPLFVNRFSVFLADQISL